MVKKFSNSGSEPIQLCGPHKHYHVLLVINSILLSLLLGLLNTTKVEWKYMLAIYNNMQSTPTHLHHQTSLPPAGFQRPHH